MVDLTEVSNLKTITDFMRWGASRFVAAKLTFGHGFSSPLDESVYLVLRALHLPVDTPDVYWSSALTETEIENIKAVIARRVNDRIPAAYITQEGWFAGLQFYIDERVLIPRSPIAELVENQFAPWVNPDEVENILDLCTGSGCIGIACAYAFQGVQVDLSDVSKEAIEVANINIDSHGAGEFVSAIESNLFSKLEGKVYDIIVSNPPYVDQEDMTALSDEFHHEPELGLSSGTQGLDLTKTILEQAAKHLSNMGILVLEVGNSQYALAELYPEVPFHWIDFERGGDGVFMLTKQQLEMNFS